MPKDFDRLLVRFRQFGGWRLVWQYARMGVLWTGTKELGRCVLQGRSFKEIYPVVTHRVDGLLLERYKDVLEEGLGKGGDTANCEKPKILWTCWLQGEEDAPGLMKACWNSWQRHLPGYEVRIVAMDNLMLWASLPDWFVEKYQRGVIPPALFSDVLRLDLLVRHGGTWLDGTVLCTGFPNGQLQGRWEAIEASELCLFRYFRRGVKEAVGLSTWFISAKRGDCVLAAARDMMLAYWRDFDCAVDYYLPHLCIGAALSRRPRLVATMPHCNSRHSILLGSALMKDFDEDAWQDLTEHVSFHKLNFRKGGEASQNPRSFYSKIMEGEGSNV